MTVVITPDIEPCPSRPSRDPEVFARLVDDHKDRIINYLTRLTGCRDRAEEAAQETFVRLYDKLDDYREEGHLTAFLFRIATNLVRSEERRRRLRGRLLHLISANGHTPARSPRRSLLANEEQAQVARALEALDLVYRAPLVMREIEGLSYREIALALDLSEGTVKSRIHRGKKKLREQLAPFWNGDS